jgi:hypothetical protein
MKWLFLLLVCSPFYVFALDNITLKFGSTSGSGWEASEIVAQVQWLSDNQMALTLEVASLTLVSLKKPFKNIKLSCDYAVYSAKQIFCPDAKLHLGGGLLDQPTVDLSFTYISDPQYLYLTVDDMALAGGNIALRAKSGPKGWQAHLNLNTLDFEQLLLKLGKFVQLPKQVKLGGNVNLKVQASGDSQDLRDASITGQLNDLSFLANQTGTLAGENIGIHIAFKAKNLNPPVSEVENADEENQSSNSVQKKFGVQGAVTLKKAELLLDPLYLTITKKQPITVSLDMIWEPERLQLNEVAYKHTDVMTVKARGDIGLGEKPKVNTLSVELPETQLKRLYTHYVQGLFDEETAVKGLETSGAIKASFSWLNAQQEAVVELININVEDAEQRFGLGGFNGKIQWHNQPALLPSHFGWDYAYLAPKPESKSKIELNASRFDLGLGERQVKLLKPWHQPLLEGAIEIEHLNLDNIGDEQMALQLGMKLIPISLSALSAAIAGPPLTGALSLDMPSLSYRNNHLAIDEKIQIGVFDGDIVVNRLNVEALLSQRPVLKADVDVNHLDLKSATQVIELGEIEGQLSGYIHDLLLMNWQPVSFDLYLGTPKDDDKPHVISHQAVKTLASLDSLAVRALSSGVLNMFNYFHYEGIGWGCQLKEGICQMRGVLPAEKGYYIIKGNGIPRLDVIGHTHTVDVNELGNRLKRLAITGQTGEPVVEF